MSLGDVRLFFNRTISPVLDKILIKVSLFAIVLLICEFGFYWPSEQKAWLWLLTELVIVFFIAQEFLRFSFADSWRGHLVQRRVEIIVSLFSMAYFLPIDLETGVPSLKIENISLLYLGLSQLIMAFFYGTRSLRVSKLGRSLHIHPANVMVLSFVVFSLLGALLLKLPTATVDGISWIDGLFIAVSALCVTGLSPLDVSEAFTPFGQGIILVLIQVGGLGIMTLTMTFISLFPGSLSVKEKILMKELLSEEKIGAVGSLLFQISSATILVEGIGSILIYWHIRPIDSGIDLEILGKSIFHSISAFCNAGFSNFSSAESRGFFQAPGFLMILSGLIILGGIGFPAMKDLQLLALSKITKSSRSHYHLSLPTKLVLVMTFLLLSMGTLTMFLLESSRSFSQFAPAEQWVHSWFFSVTSRTAGFSSLPVGELSHASVLVIIGLMWIGASPASCGGGVKTLNVALAALNIKALVRGRSEVKVFYRTIADQVLHRAFGLIALSLVLIGGGVVLLFYLQPHIPPLDLLFEVVSAWTTAGLSRGITGELSNTSKLVLIMLMLVGRVGILTILLGAFKATDISGIRYLEEDIHIH